MRKLEWVLPLLSCLFLCGCVKMALRSAPNLVPNLAQAVFEECDPTLAEQSLPADLKLMEGLLKSDPENRQLLTALCMGFTGYGLLFVEDQDPARASLLYSRARDYGLAALGDPGRRLKLADLTVEEIRKTFGEIGGADLPALAWTIMAWNAWINLNLDDSAALSQIFTAEAGVKRILEIDPAYFYGLPYVLMGTLLSAKPAMMGGDPAQSKACFDKAMQTSGGEFFLVQYYYARYYAVRAQDKPLFSRLLKEAAEGEAGSLKEACLVNAVMKRKSSRLMEKTDEFFF